MKKVLFSATGFPVTIKTLEYLQENTQEAIKGLLRDFEDYRVIWGMNINPAGNAITDGAFAYKNEIIPFIGGPIAGENPTITVNELLENANYNSNPSNVEYLEALPAYASRAAMIGTGGISTFLVSQLKHYSEQVVIAQGVSVFEDAEPVDGMFEGVVFCNHRTLTDQELENSMILYTLTRYNNTSSYMAGAKHNLLYRFKERFAISVSMNMNTHEKPEVQWQIVRFKK